MILAASADPEDDPTMAMEVLKRMSAASRRRIVDLASKKLSVGESVAVISAAVRIREVAKRELAGENR